MYPSDEGIRSQLEWNSTLNPAYAPVPTQKTKFMRKACPTPLSCSFPLTHSTDVHHCHHRYHPCPCTRSVCLILVCLKGPKVNTIEKLAELRLAGVNVGEELDVS